jgi:hypothetical protein
MADEDDIEYNYSDDDNVPDSPQRQPAVASRGGGASASSSLAGIVRSIGAEYRRLAPEELKSEQARVIRDVASILSIPPECANTLLNHFKWNRDKLFDEYTADPKAVQKAAGVSSFLAHFYPEHRSLATHLAGFIPTQAFPSRCRFASLERHPRRAASSFVTSA